MTQNRFYSSSYLPTTLAAAIVSNVSTSISVNSITGAPGSFPYTILVDWGTSTQEAMSVTASSGTGPYTLTVTRGIDGTTAQTHVNGAVVVHGVTAEDYNEPQVHISLATSGSSYPNVVHGLANGSSVVGTTDSQTLTNKTLGATSVTGAITSSVSSTSGGLINVTNTHTAPTNGNVELTAAASTDKAVDSFVSGDTVARYEVLASGKTAWGAGGASATDTNLYRNAAGELKSDQSITAAGNLTVGGAQLLAGGTGVFGVNNASVTPSTTPSGGYVAYGKNGYMKWRGGDGADYNTGSFLATLTTNSTGFANTTLTTLTGFSTPLGIGTYLVEMMVPYLPTGTIGSTSTFALSFSGTATGGSLGSFTVHNTSAQLSQNSSPSNSFVSPTHTNAVTVFQVNAVFVVTVAGTLTGQASVQTGADTMTVYAGSFLEVQPVA